MPKLNPKSVIIEKTALEFAAQMYEIGRAQGMTSKHKNARAYARANLEKFIPKAVEILIDMLGKDNVSEHEKQEIFTAIQERVNDKELVVLSQPPVYKWADGKNPFEIAKGRV